MTRALLLLLLSACTQFPQVDAVTKTDLPTPSLLPMEELLPPAQANASDPLAARITALQMRANTLRNR